MGARSGIRGSGSARVTGCQGLELSQVACPGDAGPELRRRMTDCWVAVTNAGGAAGFPFPPVSAEVVGPAVSGILAGLRPDGDRVLLASRAGELAGWVQLSRDPNPLIAHWGTVRHLQAHPASQRQGVGSALMEEARRVARDDMGLEQLHLSVRGGVGLEPFYARLGWRETGRWPGKLRFAPDDTRDEVLMILAPL